MKTCGVGYKSNGLTESFPYTSSQGIFPLSVLLLFFFLLLQAVPFSAADDDSYNQGRKGLDRSSTIILVVLLFAICSSGCLVTYYHDCFHGGNVPSYGHDILPVASASQQGHRREGLDRSEIESFPTFGYSEVRSLNIGERAPECAVCLAEFNDEATLRLLPKCDHAFHSHCIDTWLAVHTTCPVCRSDLVPVAAKIGAGSIELTAPPRRSNGDTGGLETREDRSGDVEADTATLVRYNSEGHSLAVTGVAENSDRFRLRLPEVARKKILVEPKSFQTLPMAPSARKGYRSGEGGSNSKPGQLLRWTKLVKSAGDD